MAWKLYFFRKQLFNINIMKKALFRILNDINKKILPKYSKRDFTKLNKLQKAIFGYRYFVLINSLD